MVDLVIEGATILTADAGGTAHARGVMAVENGAIVHVGPEGSGGTLATNARTRLDGTGMLVMPGLINTHCHIASTLFRGLVEDLPLEPWLQTVWKAEAAILSPETTKLGSLLGLAEMALGGVTTVVDMFWHPYQTVEAAREVGLRICAGGTVFDGPGVTGESVETRLAAAEAFMGDFAGCEDVFPAVMPHGTYTVAPENLKAAHAIAERHGGIFATHAAETRAEVKDIETRYGRSVIRHLDHLGLLGPKTILAHCVHLDDEEIEILARTGTQVSHNPVSNLKLASGVARVPEMLAAGVAVSLGTDGAVSGNDLDLWLALRLAGMLHKGMAQDAGAVPTATALDLATRAGARAIGQEGRLGSLDVGKAADFIMLDLDRAHALPMFDPLTHAVFSAGKSDVRHVFVGGRQIVEDRALTGVVLGDILGQVRALAPRVAASIA
ncbi:amidohydrolase [Pelagibacterium montanilacus]|uniref:amidohydrolase n=1 Tax=Pelagibacterium montanilacus TaxID=2185280 RepID=UPI000F8DAD3B|nr:amidohydrolase [Pelagibacterium montanilacus]